MHQALHASLVAQRISQPAASPQTSIGSTVAAGAAAETALTDHCSCGGSVMLTSSVERCWWHTNICTAGGIVISTDACCDVSAAQQHLSWPA
jgi:hypothetical protein